MFDKIKGKIVHTSKETLKDEVKTYLKAHKNEIFSYIGISLLIYLCVRSNNKPINITVNVNGGAVWPEKR